MKLSEILAKLDKATAEKISAIFINLDTKFRDNQGKIYTLREYAEQGKIIGKRKIIKNKIRYDRVKFNRMDAKEQEAYTKKLNELVKGYELLFDDDTMQDVPQKVYNELTNVKELPLKDWSEKF